MERAGGHPRRDMDMKTCGGRVGRSGSLWGWGSKA